MYQKIEMRKMRDFSAKINATFEFLRQNFKPLTKSIVFIGGPFILLYGIFNGYYQKFSLSIGTVNTSDNPFGFLSELALWFGLVMLFLLLSYLVILIVVNEYVRIYEQQTTPRVIEVGEIWQGVLRHFFPMVVVAIIVTVVISVGILLLIIPGIYVSIVLSLIVPIIIIEGKSIGDAFTRSFSLITDKWWSTFGLVFVTVLIAGFMGLMFAIPQYIFTFMLAFHKTSGEGAVPLWQEVGLIISSTIYTFGASLLQTIPIVAVIFQYYNLVERKEAAGLMSKLETFGQAKTPGATDANETY